MLVCKQTDSFVSQTPPLFENERRGGILVNRVDFSVPAKQFGCRCKRPHVNCEYCYYYLFYICKIANEQMIHDFTKNLCLLWRWGRKKQYLTSQELMYSLAYRPGLGSLSIPHSLWSFSKSSRNIICNLKRQKSNNNSF